MTQHTPDPEAWKKEFDSRFTLSYYEPNDSFVGNASPKELKLFIEQLLAIQASQYENRMKEVVEKIRNMRLLEAYMPGSQYTLEWKQGHNAAIDKILSRLQSSPE